MYDPILRQMSPERLIVTGAMMSMQLSIIEQGFRWFRSRGKMTKHFVILPEQGRDERDQAPNYMANGLSSSFVGLYSLIVGAKPRD
jgi:hypothetical protein